FDDTSVSVKTATGGNGNVAATMKASTALTPVTDNDLAALTAAARELQPVDMVGLPLKYVKGDWFIRLDKEHERKVGATEPFVIDALSYGEEWARWEKNKKPYRIRGRRIDGFIAPPRSALPDQHLTGTDDDPWEEGRFVVMRSLETD